MDANGVLALLSRQGHRITPQRSLVVETICAADSLLCAEGILAKCRQRDQRISLPTVYRTLEMLTAAEVVRKQHFGQDRCWYEGICPGEHVHHLVCQKCGARTPLARCPSKLIIEEATRNQFKVLGHQFDITGVCKDCQDEDHPGK